MTFDEAVQLFKDFSMGELECEYGDLWQMVTGRKLSNDEGRKRYYGVMSLIDLYEKNANGNDIQLVRDERNAMREQYRTVVRFERLEEIISRAVSKIPNLPTIPLQPLSGNKKQIGILQLSDWHYGLSVDNIINYYDTNIAAKRLGIVISKTLNRIKRYNLNTLYVFVQGDLVSGVIHDILRLQNQEDLMDQIIGATTLLGEAVTKLAAYCEVKVVLVGGNHERVTPKKEENLSKENYIKLVEWFLKEWLKNNNRIEIITHKDNESCYLQIFNKNIGIVHGDKDKINDLPKNMNNIYSVNFDYIFTAHLHHSNFQNIGRCFIVGNGSLCGTDEYAKNKRLFSYPMQNFGILYENGDFELMPFGCE